jgi:curved DNA-binding protein CbpA
MSRGNIIKKIMAAKQNHYEALGLSHLATSTEISRAFKSISLLHHPDKLVGFNLNEEQKAEHKAIFNAANNAYMVLSDPEARKKYDEKLQIQGHINSDRFGNDEDFYEDTEEDSDDEEEEENSFAQVQQSSVVGLSWDDGIMKYQSKGWDIQIQLDETFAEMVRADVSDFDHHHESFQIYIDITRFEEKKTKGARSEVNKSGREALSILMSRTPRLREIISVASERVWTEDDQEALYITIELAPKDEDFKFTEIELADIDIESKIRFDVESNSAFRGHGGNKGKSAEYSSLGIQQLKEMCRERGLQISGVKKELVKRLEEDDAGEQQKGRPKKVETARKGASGFATSTTKMANQRMKGGGAKGGRR